MPTLRASGIGRFLPLVRAVTRAVTDKAGPAVVIDLVRDVVRGAGRLLVAAGTGIAGVQDHRALHADAREQRLHETRGHLQGGLPGQVRLDESPGLVHDAQLERGGFRQILDAARDPMQDVEQQRL